MPVFEKSDTLVGDLVRRFLGVEPGDVAALANGDADVRMRYAPEDETTVEPLDGVDVLLRRALALRSRLLDFHGAVSLVTERQAVAAGWPSAALANRCVVFAWALSLSTGGAPSSPLLLEPDEWASEAMVPVISVSEDLAGFDELFVPYDRRPPLDREAQERAADARRDAPVIAGRRMASLPDRVMDWFGIDADADAADLDCDVFGLRMAGPQGRAVHTCIWLLNTALCLGPYLKEERVSAVRIRTERDARLAGAPGAAAANLALLLALAICQGGRHFAHLLVPTEAFAAAVEAAGRRARGRRGREGDGGEAGSLELIEIEDLVARGYLHVGPGVIGEVAWRAISLGD